MNIKFELEGYYYNNNKIVSLDSVYQPLVEQLINYLNNLIDHDGILNLINDQEDHYNPYKLTLYSDNQNYLVMLETILSDGDTGVRTLYNPLAPEGFIPILGEPYGKQSVVQDFSLVIEVFKEFLETGDVSKELLK